MKHFWKNYAALQNMLTLQSAFCGLIGKSSSHTSNLSSFPDHVLLSRTITSFRIYTSHKNKDFRWRFCKFIDLYLSLSLFAFCRNSSHVRYKLLLLQKQFDTPCNERMIKRQVHQATKLPHRTDGMGYYSFVNGGTMWRYYRLSRSFRANEREEIGWVKFVTTWHK